MRLFMWFSNTVASAMGKAIKVFMTHLSYDILWTTSVQFFMTCQSSSRLTKNKNIKFFPLFTLSTVDENHLKSLILQNFLVHFGKQTVWKWLKLYLNFCPIKSDLSGNTVWPQASCFQKFAKIGHFLAFFTNFVAY